MKRIATLTLLLTLSLPTHGGTKTKDAGPARQSQPAIVRFAKAAKNIARIKRNDVGQCTCNELGDCSIEQAWPSPPIGVSSCP